MNALERHKQKIRDRFEEGIGLHPFWALSNHVQACWQAEKNETTEMAHQIMHSAEVNSRLHPGCTDLEDAFEKVYHKHPRKAVVALDLILACPTETGYKEYVAERIAAAREGRQPKYSALFHHYGVPDEVLQRKE